MAVGVAVGAAVGDTVRVAVGVAAEVTFELLDLHSSCLNDIQNGDLSGVLKWRLEW